MRRSLISVVALALLAAIPQAWAQQSVLQGGAFTRGHVPMYAGQGSSQPVVQDSGTAAGGAAGLGLSELLIVQRGTGTAPYANAGSGPSHTNLCDYDGPTTSAAGYHSLCFGPNSGGGGLITYNAGGAASDLPLNIVSPAGILVNGLPLTGSNPIVGNFTFTSQTCTLYVAFSQECMRIIDTTGGNIPYYLDKYGHVLIGDVYSHFTNLECQPGISASLCNGGLALRIYGDILAGDLVYFGATSTAGTEVMQIATRAWGAYASATVINSGWQNYQVDTTPAGNCTPSSTQCGGAYILLHPDDTNQTTTQGSIELNAFGQTGGNQIIMATRSGVNAITTRWTIGSTGGLFSGSAVGGDLGANTLNVGASARMGSASTDYITLAGSSTDPSVTTNGGNLALAPSGGIVKVQNGGAPTLSIEDTVLGTDLKSWVFASSGNLAFQASKDDHSAATNAYVITRGTTYNVADHDWYISTAAGTPVQKMHLDNTSFFVNPASTFSSTLLVSGALTASVGETITTGGLTVSGGGITVTGNSTITGTLVGLTGLTVASGGAAVTGNSTITGTLNVTAGYSINGAAGVTQTCTVNTASALTLIFTNGILTGGSCNS